MYGVQMSMWDGQQSQDIAIIRGHKIAITGQLGLRRADAVSLIASFGGIYVTSVTKHTDYLVTGEFRQRRGLQNKDTRKLAAAKHFISTGGKIKLLSPTDFYTSIGLK